MDLHDEVKEPEVQAMQGLDEEEPSWLKIKSKDGKEIQVHLFPSSSHACILLFFCNDLFFVNIHPTARPNTPLSKG